MTPLNVTTSVTSSMNTDIKNRILLDMLEGKSCSRYPVWVMRQAGRVLPEYREVRAKAGNFINLVKSPEMCCEVTLQPVDLLGVDAAIIFSDILVVPEAMGFPYEMIESRGPVFPKTIRSAEEVDSLEVADVEDRLSYVLEAIRLTKKELNGRVPLIGFAGAPLTIFAYLVEGKGSKTFSEARKLLYTQPEAAHKALDRITNVSIAYLRAQVKAGADLVQIFDSWAGIFSPEQYATFGVPYMEKIAKALSVEVPVTLFPKGAWFALETFAKGSCTTLGIDWNTPLTQAREWAGDKALQGNLDPTALYGSRDEIEKATRNMLSLVKGNRHIANLGHGVYPDTEADKLKCFIETVKEFEIKS